MKLSYTSAGHALTWLIALFLLAVLVFGLVAWRGDLLRLLGAPGPK